MATDPQQVRHLEAGAGLLGLDEIESLHALLSPSIALGMQEPSQFLGRFVNRRDGLFHGDLLRQSMNSALCGAHRLPFMHHCQEEMVLAIYRLPRLYSVCI